MVSDVGIVFLLGSGISRNAEMPGVNEITTQVLSGEGVFFHTDKTFVIGAKNSTYELYRPPVEPVLGLIDDLRGRATEYFGREPSYEEISLLARQVDDALSREYESAAVMPFVEQLMERPYVQGREHLRELSELTLGYIADSVHQMLGKPPTCLDHLSAIIDACKHLSRVDLATLNHDLVLEAALDAAGIEYADGFDHSDEDVRLWIDNWKGASVRLLKLHGSLDWWGYEVADEPFRGWVVGRYKGDDPIHPRRAGIVAYPHDLRPIFLTGTFDKILAYETWVFPDQHLRFQEALRGTKRVAVIGYGFGDKAINTRLIGWLACALDHKLIVCHPDPDRLSERARGAVQSKWAHWQRHGQLAFIRTDVAGLDYERLIELVG